MKSLYESILGSTKSGKISMVKKWAEENLNFWRDFNKEDEFLITGDGKIVNKPRKNINMQLVKERVPDYIQFGEITEGFFIGTALNLMKQEQLPPKVQQLYISGNTGTIPTFEMECTHGVSINEYAQNLKAIEPIYLKCEITQNGNHKPMLNFDLTQIKLDDIKNIHDVNGTIYSLYIKKTPAAEELKKTVKKLDKKQAKAGGVKLGERSDFEKYLDELFEEWKGLRFIYLSDRTCLERNPKTTHWYLV